MRQNDEDQSCPRDQLEGAPNREKGLPRATLSQVRADALFATPAQSEALTYQSRRLFRASGDRVPRMLDVADLIAKAGQRRPGAKREGRHAEGIAYRHSETRP